MSPFGQPIINDKDGKPIRAQTQGQYELIQAIDKYDILFVNGSSGTGKSFLAVCKAVEGMLARKYERIIITRPAVESGEDLGFLPGSLNDKIYPYMKPIFDCIEELKPEKTPHIGNGNGIVSINGNGKKKKKKKLKFELEPITTTPIPEIVKWEDKIEISPLAYMRGLTLKNSFIICDEAQNMKISQMKMFLTRLGVNSKVVITGDSSQSDLDKNLSSGFRHAQAILKGIDEIGFVTLTEKDIVRHKLIKDIILRYEKYPCADKVKYNKKYENSEELSAISA
jgi:phosphate starvation-inducible PhoH-like protein